MPDNEMAESQSPSDPRGSSQQGDEIVALLRHQTALARFGELSLKSESLDEILHEACRLVGEALGTDLAKVLELQEDGRTLLVKAGVGWKPGIVGHTRIEAEESSSEGHALQTNEPVISTDVRHERRFSIPGFLLDNGVQALVNVVIIGGRERRPYGGLQVDSRDSRSFTNDDISFLRTYANLLAASVDRLRVLEETRRNDAFSRGILAASPDCVKVLDTDGTLQFMNEQGLWLNEIVDLSQILGRNFVDLWPAEEASKLRDAIRGAIAGQVTRINAFCPTALGKPRWWEVSFAPMLQGDGTPMRLVGVSRDITTRHLAEVAAEEARSRLRVERELLDTLIRQAPIGISIAEATTGGALVLNDRAREMIGHGALGDDINRYRDYGAVHADGTPYAIEDYPTVRALRHGEVVRDEEMIYRRGGAGTEDGSTRRLEVSSTPIRDEMGAIAAAITILQDIEDKRQAEEGLRRANDQLEVTVAERTVERDKVWNLSPDLFVVVGSDGQYRNVNPAWTAALDYARDELVGLRFDQLSHPDDVDVVRAAFDRLLAGGAVSDLDARTRHRDGSYRSYNWTCTPADGEVYAVGRDVTERKQLEEQLRQSQKMEAVGQLTGGLAHDFNNLLTGIIGSLELLQTRVAQGRLGTVDRYVAAARSAADRAAALTHRLLAFSRRQTLAPKPTDVRLLMSGMEELIRRTVGPAIAVDVVGAVGLWSALVDPNQLENALLNLCINARDAMPDGGKLTVEADNKVIDARMARDLDMPAAEYLALCVTDNGTGMSPEVIAKAFDPFFTTKPIGEGTGLGLSMIYGFVRQSGGQVRITSEVGQGTTVCLYLPRHLGEAGRVEAQPELTDVPRAERGETVLVVDDEPTVRMLVTEVLEELGYMALEAADGTAGLHILQSDARIDLLVTDVGLPGGMNGRQMADAGRAVRPDLKVLFITGYAENAVLSHGHLATGMHVLIKPFAMEVLASRIRELIAVS